MALQILGLSHKTAPIEVREKVAFDSAQLAAACRALQACRGVAESMILSTCNRTEIYCDMDSSADREALLHWLTAYRALGVTDLEPHIYRLDDELAVRHVLRVASGLDSMVVGEPQILGQLKQAYSTAVDAGTVGKLLNRLLQFSFSTAKRVRTETEIGDTPVSIAFAAVKLAQQIHGNLAARSALLIGAGDTISLVASHLDGAGIGQMLVTNRTRANADALAARYGAEVLELHDMPSRLHEADIVVTSTASRVPVVTRGVVEIALASRIQEAMFLVDLAVPRDIEPGVAELADVYLYSVDDLESVVRANLKLRTAAAAQAEEMVNLHVQDYMDWLQIQDSAATITSFRTQAAQIRDEVLDKARAQLARGEDPENILHMLAHALTNKLIHQPTSRLRGANGREDFIRIARELLGIDADKG